MGKIIFACVMMMVVGGRVQADTFQNTEKGWADKAAELAKALKK